MAKCLVVSKGPPGQRQAGDDQLCIFLQVLTETQLSRPLGAWQLFQGECCSWSTWQA